jgi:hypothetical protein
MEQPSEHEAKMLFAAYLHKTGKTGEAMRLIAEEYGWPTHDFASTAIALSKRWERDDIVIAELQRLRTTVRSKEETANSFWTSYETAMRNGDYKAAATLGRLFADTVGYTIKVSTAAKNEGTGDNFDELAYNVPPIVDSESVIVEANAEVVEQ